MGARDRIIGLALLVPVALAVVFSWTRLILEPFDVPADEDYVAAAAFLHAQHLSEGDAIVVQPPWSLRPLQFLGEDARFVVAGDGPALLLARHRRLFALVEPDAPVELSGQERARFGAVRIVEAEAGGSSYDFRDHFFVDSGKATRQWAQVTENGSDVVVVSTPATLSWDEVVIGKELVVAAGHTRDGADDGTTGVVTMTASIDGTVVGLVLRRPTFVVEPWRRGLRETFVAPVDEGYPGGMGFRAEVFDTSRFAGQRHNLKFVISADGETSRDFAFDAYIPAQQEKEQQP